jgi:hypothetical protein
VEPGSDEEEEEEEMGSSTPSAENSDKNIMSMLCVSMESVDQVGRRERFMQSNFESLSGGDDQSMTSATTNSISNAWREGSAHQRNAGTIAAARQMRDAEQNRRREELQRRIEETRMKLQNIGYRSMKGSQSINDLSSFPEAGPGTSTLPRTARGKDATAGQRKPRPKSLYISAVTNSMTNSTKTYDLQHNTSARFSGSESEEVCPLVSGCDTSIVGLSVLGALSTSAPIVTGNSTFESSTNRVETVNKDQANNGSDSDDTLHGDLGSSSGFVGSSNLSSVSSVTEFKLNSPCANFPMTVSPLCYRTGSGISSIVSSSNKLSSVLSSSYAKEEAFPPSSIRKSDDKPSSGEEFSDDSLAESPGKRNRVSRRLKELAKQIDEEDSLAHVDSLADEAFIDSIVPDKVPCLPWMSHEIIELDSLFPNKPLREVEVDSLEPNCAVKENLEMKLNEINAKIETIETIQLRKELDKLKHEIVALSCSESTSSPSRARWTKKDIEIATDDLSNNREMSFSYENMAPLLSSRRTSAESTDSSSTLSVSTGNLAITDHPLPKKATHPSPIPSFPRISMKKEKHVSGFRELVEHSGAVGVTSMWIAAPIKPKIHSRLTNNTNATNIPRINIRDNGTLNKKLQIQTVLPNKAEGSVLACEVSFIQIIQFDRFLSTNFLDSCFGICLME